MVQPLWKTTWQFLNELNIELSYDLAIHSNVYTYGRKWRTKEPLDESERGEWKKLA